MPAGLVQAGAAEPGGDGHSLPGGGRAELVELGVCQRDRDAVRAAGRGVLAPAARGSVGCHVPDRRSRRLAGSAVMAVMVAVSQHIGSYLTEQKVPVAGPVLSG